MEDLIVLGKELSLIIVVFMLHYSLSEENIETIMINCNPETVSTDYDTSNKLYFEPLTLEDIHEIVKVENSKGNLLGLIIQYGGQTPLKLFKINLINIKLMLWELLMTLLT